ncbi:glycoside hydrolase family 2 TIM barrel-domain containing protein [Parabacteroides goldsteinii]|uniref:glycoside hydrolase family 2 TIM barrel-domain containing protein n=1 Tax=Parabacteroides goldsteinii TaxID=328812 RepID=UPI003AEFE86B
MNVRKLFYLLVSVLCLQSVSATDFTVPRLSPLPVKVEKQKIPLGGSWQFNPSPEKEFWKQGSVTNWKSIEVPGEWVMQGFEVEKGKAAGYFRTFSVPSSWNGQRIKLRCNGIYSDSHIYINGKEAGAHLGGFTAFELDVTELVQTGKENRIAVSVRSESLADSTSSGSQYAVHPLGGITRDMYLFTLPDVNMSMFHVNTSFDSTYMDAVLKTDIEISNESSVPASNLSLHFSLEDANGKEIALKQNTNPVQKIAAGATEKASLSFSIAKPEKWDSEHPYLYTLTCRLKDGKKVLHETVRRVGFRQVEVRGNQMYINNMPVKLRGVCRHEVMPLRGRSVNDGMWRKDVELFRRGNVNYIRTSHYPPDEALLEACDELGMLVEVEAPFCWAHNTNVPEEMHDAVLVNQHVEMVNLNRSHPSVIMWSLGNESLKYAEYFKKAGEVVKQMDPTRPRIFSQWGPDADNGELEVTNHHYPGPTGPNKYRNSKRPVTFDEFCHLNAYNRLELAADPGLRSMWGPLLDQMWNNMYHSQGVLGGAIWAGIDDTFFLPGEKAVGYGTWGPIDGWRREKPEYWGMKKAFSPVKIVQKGNMSADGIVRFHVENRHNFSDLSECSIVWKAGGKSGRVTTDMAPRSEGEFEIQLPESLRNAEKLELTVTGVRGFVIDEYSFRILPEQIKPQGQGQSGQLSCQEKADVIEIQSVGGVFTVDKRNGLLSAGQGGNAVLLQSPALMVLPLNGDGEGVQMVGKDQKFKPYNPVCENWIAQSVTCLPGDELISIKVKGIYKEAEGIFEYRFHKNGEVIFVYDFTMLQDISPRQTGLVFTLPSSFTHLDWKRKGYWNVYPEDHIGALTGQAEAFDASLPVSGLAGPSKQPVKSWSYDQTAAGSNMFRSTKENIYSARLKDGSGQSVTVKSDGTQYVRAWIEGDAIRLLVADYNNPGKENFLIPHAEKGYKPLRKGDKVQGKVTVSFHP